VETKRERNDNRERLRDLAAKIATEQDHDKFTQLVKELTNFWMENFAQSHDSAR
jgi:hypothetical protein